MTNNILIETYFLNRYCIKSTDTQQQRFRFNDQSNPIDIHGQLHVIVSSDILHSFTKQYRDQVYQQTPLYFIIVNENIDQWIVLQCFD